jgi:hypothetical protein
VAVVIRFFLAGLAGGVARCMYAVIALIKCMLIDSLPEKSGYSVHKMYAKPLESWKKRVSGVNSDHFMIVI